MYTTGPMNWSPVIHGISVEYIFLQPEVRLLTVL